MTLSQPSRELYNAHRTIDKCEEMLQACASYFRHQAEMNCIAHLGSRVMYPPIHASIESVLKAVEMFHETYPDREDHP